MKKIIILTVLFLSLVLVSYSGTINLSVENDCFSLPGMGSSDHNYTHGTRIMWDSDTNSLQGKLLDNFSIFDKMSKSSSYMLGQYIYTPTDKTTKEYIPTDRPYASWLYAGFLAQARDKNTLDMFELDLGITGPPALGQETQNEVHKLIGNKLAQGWKNQIKTEPGVDFLYQKKAKYCNKISFIEMDAIPHLGGALGNIYTYANADILTRIGYNLPDDFGYLRMEPGTRAFNPKNISIYLFSDEEKKIMVRNIFLDGNTFRDSAHIRKHNYIDEYTFGCGVSLWNFSAIYAYTIRSPEFYGQKDDHRFGTISLGWKF